MYPLVEAFVKKVDESSRNQHGDTFGWFGGVAVILTIFFIYSQVAITYTHGSLVATLAMVEDTSPTAIIQRGGPPKDGLPAYTDDPDAPPPSYSAEEVLLLSPTPITSSNRGTVRHLKRIGGRGARFRGLGIAILYGCASHYLSWGLFAVTGGNGPLGMAVCFVVGQMVLFRLNLLWTHVVISAPRTDVRMRERFVSWHRAKKAVMPTLGWALAQLTIPTTVLVLVPALGIDLLVSQIAPKLERNEALATDEVLQIALVSGALLAAVGLLIVCVYVPVTVALTRCQASLLDEAEVPIVPLDRSFGGRVDPENPRMRLRSAWDSFDWNGRMRLAKVYAKTLAFQMLAATVYLVALFLAAVVWVAA